MELKITGKIIAAMPEQSGTSSRGNAWKKRNYVLETMDSYPTKVCFEFFGDRVDNNPLAIGNVINLYFDIDSHEYNERWYTTIRGLRAEQLQATGAPVQPAAVNYAPATPVVPEADPFNPAAPSPTDDLPF